MFEGIGYRPGQQVIGHLFSATLQCTFFCASLWCAQMGRCHQLRQPEQNIGVRRLFAKTSRAARDVPRLDRRLEVGLDEPVRRARSL